MNLGLGLPSSLGPSGNGKREAVERLNRLGAQGQELLLYHSERSCDLVSSADATCGDNLASDGSLGLFLVIGSKRTTQPIQDILDSAGNAVVILRGKEPHAVGGHDGISDLLNTFRSWEFFVLIEQRDVQNVDNLNLRLALQGLCGNLTQRFVERILTTRTDDKYNFLHEQTSP